MQSGEVQRVDTTFGVDQPGIDHNNLSLATPPEAWLRWTAFRYQLPTRSQPRRVAVWRALRAMHAVNLDPGLWAIPHDARGELDLTRVAALVAGWDGRIEHREMRSAGLDDIEEQVRLWRSCERVWDEFLSGVDRLSIRLSAAASDHQQDHLALQALREDFARCLVDDLVGSDAAARARVRLSALTGAIVEAHPELAGGPEPDRDHRRVKVELRAGWGMDDGRARHVVVLCPTPTVAWERAFEEFESSVYAPSPERMRFRHGAAAIVSQPGAVDDVVEGARSRVALFQLAL